MKIFEALSMLCAAREGLNPTKEQAVAKYGERSKAILHGMGMKDADLNQEYPDDRLQDGLRMISTHPTMWAAQTRAAAAWLISRN